MPKIDGIGVAKEVNEF
jgi:hypothetical protein